MKNKVQILIAGKHYVVDRKVAEHIEWLEEIANSEKSKRNSQKRLNQLHVKNMTNSLNDLHKLISEMKWKRK